MRDALLSFIMLALFCGGGLLVPTIVHASVTDGEGVAAVATDGEADDPSAPDSTRTTILYGYVNHSKIDFGSVEQSWSVIGAGAAFAVGPTATLNIEGVRETRAAAHYARFSARYDGDVTESMHFYLAAAIGSGAPIRENWSVSAGGSKAINSSIAVTLDTRIAKYDRATTGGGASVKTVIPGIRIVPKAMPVELAAKWINFWDQDGTRRHGYSFSGTYYFGDADFIFSGYSHYPETDSGITRLMRTVHVGVRHSVGKRLALRVTAEQLVRQNSYRQRALTFGLEFRL